MGTYKAVLIVISALMVELGGGEDLYWKPNSNWGNPDNWALGRVPACGDSASFKNAPANSVVFVDSDTTLSSLALPANGQLVLGPSITIRLSPDVECEVSGDTQPMAAVVNEFVGADTDYWECSDNWQTLDGSDVVHSPCATDAAIFEKGSFSFVGANTSIYVRSLVVRGTTINTMTDTLSTEFKLKLEVNANCGDNPSLCPCPNDKGCPKKEEGNTGKVTNVKKRDGIIAGVILALILVATVVLCVVVFVVTMYLRRGTPYMKEELIDEPGADPAVNSDGKLYDNPLFSNEVKVDLGEAAEAPPPENEEQDPKMNKYQRF